MIDPAVFILNLAGDGELIVFSRKTFAVFLNDTSNADTAKYGRGYGETFNHGDIPYRFNKLCLPIKKPSFDGWAVMCLLRLIGFDCLMNILIVKR